MIHVIVSEMLRGNFSFLILVVGILQLWEMIKRNVHDKVEGQNDLQSERRTGCSPIKAENTNVSDEVS